MGTFPKREMVELWRCSRDHRHTTLALAKQCQEATKRRADQSGQDKLREDRLSRRQTREKYAHDLREAGNSWAEVGRIVGRADNSSKPVCGTVASSLVSRRFRRLFRESRTRI